MEGHRPRIRGDPGDAQGAGTLPGPAAVLFVSNNEAPDLRWHDIEKSQSATWIASARAAPTSSSAR